MIVKWIWPIGSMAGSITKEYYVRMLCGKQVIQHKPRKAMSEKKKQVCKAFGEKYGTSRKK